MPQEDVLNIITGVAEALDYAHQQGLLHRDVKPANIMLSDPTEGEQRVLLGDFGIARRVDDTNNLTATNMTVGTVFYAAPEQLMGEDLDGRADQYALAATAFHLLSGSPPFHHSNPTVVISQHLTASPPAISDRRPELSALDPVLAQGPFEGPEGSVHSCMDFSRALAHRLGVEPAADNERTEASVPIAPARGGGKHEAQQPPRRKYLRPAYIVPAILAALLLVAIALVLIQFREIEKLLNDDYTAAAVTAARDRATRRVATAAPSPADDDGHHLGAALPAAAFVGADCSPVGSTATTANGNTVYCSTLESTGASIWSTEPGRGARRRSRSPPTSPTSRCRSRRKRRCGSACRRRAKPAGNAARPSGPATKAATERHDAWPSQTGWRWPTSFTSTLPRSMIAGSATSSSYSARQPNCGCLTPRDLSILSDSTVAATVCAPR